MEAIPPVRPIRVLLVTHYFPPYDHIASARTGKTAKYLERFGHDVRVIAARDTLTPFRQMPLEIAAEKVTYTPWLSAGFRADLALNTLAQKAAALRASTGRKERTPGQTRSPAGARGRSRATVAGKAIRDALRTLLYFPDSQIGWLPYGLAAGRDLLRRWRPDVILASSGPHTALIIASMLSREFEIPWVAEFRDLWVDNHQYQHPQWRKTIETRFERRIVSTASALVTVSNSLAERLRSRYSAEVAVVYNGFDPGDHQAARAPVSSACLTIVYTGWVYERHDLAPLFNAVRLLGVDANRVQMIFYRADSRMIRWLAATYSVAHAVETREGVPFMESLRVQRGADVLLYLSWNDPNEKGIFSGKLFQYFGAHRPILAVGPTDNEPARLIRERGLGFVSSDPGEIAARISGWLAEKAEANGIADIPAERAAEFSRENQTRRLENLLANVVARSTAPA